MDESPTIGPQLWWRNPQAVHIKVICHSTLSQLLGWEVDQLHAVTTNKSNWVAICWISNIPEGSSRASRLDGDAGVGAEINSAELFHQSDRGFPHYVSALQMTQTTMAIIQHLNVSSPTRRRRGAKRNRTWISLGPVAFLGFCLGFFLSWSLPQHSIFDDTEYQRRGEERSGCQE